MLVEGSLTVETLLDTFRSESRSSQIGGSIASISGLIQGVKVNRAYIDPRLGVVPTMRIADEEVLEEKIGEVARLIGTEKFYLKVGELLYNKGGMISDGAVAGRRIDEPVRERSTHKRTVINPSVGELISCFSKIDEFNEVRAKYMMQRVTEGASMTQAKKEAEQITQDVVEKAKALKAEKIAKREAVLDEIERKLPTLEKVPDEARAAMLKKYLDEHGGELREIAERYTLEELRAETEFVGSLPQSLRGSQDTVRRILAEPHYPERPYRTPGTEFADTLKSIGIGMAESLNRLCIPGYAAYASGGDVTEVASSAASDLALTIFGGKVIKMAWTETRALCRGARALGTRLLSESGNKVRVIERAKITWGMWDDLPKATLNGKEYAKIGDRYYSQHAVDYMTPKNMRAELGIPASQELRGIPSSVVENAIKHGKRTLSTKGIEPRYLYNFEDITVVTDIDSKIVISLGKRSK